MMFQYIESKILAYVGKFCFLAILSFFKSTNKVYPKPLNWPKSEIYNDQSSRDIKILSGKGRTQSNIGDGKQIMRLTSD